MVLLLPPPECCSYRLAPPCQFYHPHGWGSNPQVSWVLSKHYQRGCIPTPVNPFSSHPAHSWFGFVFLETGSSVAYISLLVLLSFQVSAGAVLPLRGLRVPCYPVIRYDCSHPDVIVAAFLSRQLAQEASPVSGSWVCPLLGLWLCVRQLISTH